MPRCSWRSCRARTGPSSVAIKRVRADLANQRPFVGMLIEEAHQTAQLSHPNLVSVLDFDRDTLGQPYLVMEYVDGVDLGRLVETGPYRIPSRSSSCANCSLAWGTSTSHGTRAGVA